MKETLYKFFEIQFLYYRLILTNNFFIFFKILFKIIPVFRSRKCQNKLNFTFYNFTSRRSYLEVEHMVMYGKLSTKNQKKL